MQIEPTRLIRTTRTAVGIPVGLAPDGSAVIGPSRRALENWCWHVHDDEQVDELARKLKEMLRSRDERPSGPRLRDRRAGYHRLPLVQLPDPRLRRSCWAIHLGDPAPHHPVTHDLCSGAPVYAWVPSGRNAGVHFSSAAPSYVEELDGTRRVSLPDDGDTFTQFDGSLADELAELAGRERVFLLELVED